MNENEKGVSILDTPYAKSFIHKLENRNKGEGSVFDLFTAMKDVDIFLKWLEPTITPEIMEAMKFMLGVADQEGKSVLVEGVGEIDKSIASFVEALNRRGFATLSSCSGLSKEHPNKKARMSGYLSFLNEGAEYLLSIKEICKELKLPCEEGKAYFKPSLTVQFIGDFDEEIENKWKSFEKKLCIKEGRESL